MADRVRLGVIGANPDSGWAAISHLPAVAAMPDIELVAVATTRMESAAAAAERYGAHQAFDNPFDLIASPDVEAVTVAVRVPRHFALVDAAIEAGKHVFCEWPLGVDTAEAAILAEKAARRQVTSIIGLQGRRSAVIRRVSDLVADGYLGAFLSATFSASLPVLGGPTTTAATAWFGDVRNGANLLSIVAGHALDTVAAIVGEPSEVSAVVTTRIPTARVVETDEIVAVTSPDQVAVAATTTGGGVIAAHLRSGTPGGPTFQLSLNGTDGLLELAAPFGLSGGSVTLTGARADGTREELAIPASYRLVPPTVPAGPPVDVAHLYLDFVAALRDGRSDGPDFALAVGRHRLIDAIRAASDTGQRQTVGLLGA